MADFVTDNCANGAEVMLPERLAIKNGGCKIAAGEIQRVLQRKIYGIHGLRRHGPFFAIGLLTEASDFELEIEHSAAPDVAEDIIRLVLRNRHRYARLRDIRRRHRA